MKIKFGGKWYEVAMVQYNFGKPYYEIYDEPDTDPEHTDWIIHPEEVIDDDGENSSFNTVSNSESVQCNKRARTFIMEEELTELLKKEIDDEVEREIWQPLRKQILANPEKLALSCYISGLLFSNKNSQDLFDKRFDENGVKCHVWYKNGWNVESEKNGVVKSTHWHGYEPHFGVDVFDAQKINETLESYITNFEEQ